MKANDIKIVGLNYFDDRVLRSFLPHGGLFEEFGASFPDCELSYFNTYKYLPLNSMEALKAS